MPYLSHLTGEKPTERQPDIYYRDYGTGAETIVLIHGWPFSLDMWEHQWTTLPHQGYRVIGYDRRGFGKSGKPFGPCDYTTLASDLKRLLDGLDVSNVTLVGFSMGGGEVARYLGEYGGDRVARAVFVSSVTPYLQRSGDNQAGVDPDVFQQMRHGLREDRAKFLATWAKDFYGSGFLSNPVSSEWERFTFNKVMEASPVATLACAEAFAATDFREDLRQISIPTLVISGSKDGVVPPEVSAHRMREFVPHAHILDYDGAPHALPVTTPDKFNGDLKRFITDNPVGAISSNGSATPAHGSAIH